MLSGIKVYKVKDFIRKTETGKIDLNRSKQISKTLLRLGDLVLITISWLILEKLQSLLKV
jgi:hypothetical protein